MVGVKTMKQQLIEKLLEKLLNDNGEQRNFYMTESNPVHPWVIGNKYFIRTVTMHLVGHVIAVTDKEILLKNASWIADSGRFHDALKSGEFDEIEPFVNDVIVNRNSVIDATIFDHPLPSEQK